MDALTTTECSPTILGNLVAKYASVSKETTASGIHFSQRSLLVRIPQRKSPTGRVNVNGAKRK
jgi:hypothetical protein